MLKLLDNYLVNYVFFEHQGESFVFRMILEI